MASAATPLPIGILTLPHEDFRGINEGFFVNAHPLGALPSNELGSFKCEGCKKTREVSLLSNASLHRNLPSNYPLLLTSIKISQIVPVDHILFLGYMCKGCASFHQRVSLCIEYGPMKLALRIQDIFMNENGQAFIQEPDQNQNPLTYLDHLRDNNDFSSLFNLEEGRVEQIIRDHNIRRFSELCDYVNANENQAS